MNGDGGRRPPAPTHLDERLRPCRPADAPAVVDLYNRCFQARLTVEGFRWRYIDAPGADLGLSVVCERHGRIEGFVGAAVQPWWWRGARVTAIRIQDVCVAPPARGRGLFTRMLRAQCALDAPHAFRFAFPNPRSRPAFTRDGLFHRHPDVPTWRCPIPARSAQADDLPAGVEVTVASPPRFDLQDSALFDRLRADLPVRGARDVDWLRWRFGPASPHDYRVVRAHDGDRLVGLLIAKHYAPGRSVDIVELCAEEGPPIVTALVRAAVDRFARCAPRTLEMWAPRRYTRHAHLQRLGFVVGERYTALVTRCVDPPSLQALPGVLVMTDSDVY